MVTDTGEHAFSWSTTVYTHASHADVREDFNGSGMLNWHSQASCTPESNGIIIIIITCWCSDMAVVRALVVASTAQVSTHVMIGTQCGCSWLHA
jgi:hypothetical protein